MIVQTSRFGELEIDDDRIITFAGGLPGFETMREFVVIDHRPDSPVKWLQCVDDPVLAMLVCDPFEFYPDYAPVLSDENLTRLGNPESDDIIVLTIITVTDNPKDMTANLLAPLFIDTRKRMGIQAILVSTEYGTRHRIVPTAQ